MTEKVRGRWITVVLWMLGIGMAAYVVVAWLIPAVATAVTWAGTSGGAATLVWLGVWAVCGLVAFAITGLFMESFAGRVVIALLGTVALGILVVYLVFSWAFSTGGRR
jgi:hypothetical protein